MIDVAIAVIVVVMTSFLIILVGTCPEYFMPLQKPAAKSLFPDLRRIDTQNVRLPRDSLES